MISSEMRFSRSSFRRALAIFLYLKKLAGTGEPEQFLRAHYRAFQPLFLLFKVFVGVWFKVNVLRGKIFCSFQVIEIVVDLLGCKQPSDFIDEGRHLGSEQGIALGRVQEGEEFLADQIVQRVIQAELLVDIFGCRALIDPDFVELYWGTVYAWVLLSRIRRTEVRPMLRRRAISDLLMPARRSLRT